MDCITFLEEARQHYLLDLPFETAFLALFTTLTVLLYRWKQPELDCDGVNFGPAAKWVGIVLLGCCSYCQGDYVSQHVVYALTPVKDPDTKFYCAENLPLMSKEVE